MIVVLDSGIWISALHFGGTPLAALDRAFVYDQIAVCDPILLEISKILASKFGWDERDIQAACRSYLTGAVKITVRGSLKNICRDPKDDMIFECAVAAKAAAIVSGDKDILTVGQYQSTRILTARQYLEQ